MNAALRKSVSSLENSPHDGLLREQIIVRLGELGKLFALRIHVEVTQGEVILRGRVASQADKLVLLHVVQSLSGVQRIQDRIFIGLKSRMMSETESPVPFLSSWSRMWLGFVLMAGLGTAIVWAAGTEPATRSIRAHVAFEGKPPVGAVVTLHPRNSRIKSFPYGSVQKDGLVLWTGAGKELPVALGEYAVTVTWNRLIGGGNQLQCGPNLLPQRYAQVQTSPLSLSVKRSGGGVVQLEMKK